MLASRQPQSDTKTESFYRRVMQVLKDREIPFLVGGAFALGGHTGIVRHTKDIDLFVRPEDCPRALDELREAGFRTEFTDAVWLGKVFEDDDFVDFVFRSGNGLAQVDDIWFANSERTQIFGVEVELCPPEETIWSKAFTMERERYDGADIAHLILVRGPTMDWDRLVARFGDHWRVLLSHLTLFGFIYPGETGRIPPRVMNILIRRLACEVRVPADRGRICRGTLVSRQQYVIDIRQWGYEDVRFASAELPPETLSEWRGRVEKENEDGIKHTFADEREMARRTP